MKVNLNNSRRTATKFVQAQKNAAVLSELSSQELKTRIRGNLLAAQEELDNDPVAQQLVSSARDFERQKQARRKAIEEGSLLGQLARKLEQIADGEVQASPKDFEETLIDDE